MNSTTMNIPLNQITQSIKIECRTDNSINIPFFFSTVENKKKNVKKDNSTIKSDKITAKKDNKKN